MKNSQNENQFSVKNIKAVHERVKQWAGYTNIPAVFLPKDHPVSFTFKDGKMVKAEYAVVLNIKPGQNPLAEIIRRDFENVGISPPDEDTLNSIIGNGVNMGLIPPEYLARGVAGKTEQEAIEFLACEVSELFESKSRRDYEDLLCPHLTDAISKRVLGKFLVELLGKDKFFQIVEKASEKVPVTNFVR